MKRIKERIFNKDINKEEYKRILSELSKFNKTEKELLDECNDNIIFLWFNIITFYFITFFIFNKI